MRRVDFLTFSLPIFLAMTCLSVACIPASCAADRRWPDLEFGMGYREVIQSWGAPSEKQEFEAKREDVWLYNGAKVFFREGKIVAWTIDRDEGVVRRGRGVTTVADGAEKEAVPQAHSSADLKTVQEILSEIMAEGEPEAGAAPAKP